VPFPDGETVKKSGLFVSLLIVGGIFLIVWRLRGDSDGATGSAAPEDGAVAVSETPGEVSHPAVSAAAEADGTLAQAEEARRRGDHERAAEIFESLLNRFPDTPAAASAALKLADVCRETGDLCRARNVLSDALEGMGEGPRRQEVVDELHRLNGELVFSRKETTDSITYVVKSGDNLVRIGKEYDITPEFIKRINYLTSDVIHPGDRLKLFQGPFDVVIEKSKFRLTLRRAGIFIKEYTIGLGKNGSTPEGEYTVINKLVNPVWNPPGPEYAAADDPENPLGTRWIGFMEHYGIHGTVEPETIGRQDSRGCVRLLNEDVEELFDLVVRGSKVIIKP